MKNLPLRLMQHSMKARLAGGWQRTLVYTFEGEALRHR